MDVPDRQQDQLTREPAEEAAARAGQPGERRGGEDHHHTPGGLRTGHEIVRDAVPAQICAHRVPASQLDHPPESHIAT
ncbi:hypothetical protein Psi02_60670 [Planotetraspora silvatica]|uniref:Uncharacterized protein n=1 Tax=Planotetraspora silvatica TaxID=234614 RepID=A0A8J3UQV2_9ACTN|nr:hypothetical protein Psi02_60670 [Planotetraspora silvatica]